MLFGLVRLPQNVLDPLESDRNGCKIGRAPDFGNCSRPGHCIYNIVSAGGQDRIHHVVGKSELFPQVELQSLAEERANRFFVIKIALEFRFRRRPLIGLARQCQQLSQPNRQLVLGNGLHNSIRLSPQREWILRSGRLQSQREHPRNRVGLIGNREHRTFHRTRNCVLRRFRPVLVVNSVCDQLPRRIRHALIEFLHACIESADNPLKLRKFLHQFGCEVGFRETCGFVHDSGPDRRPALAQRFSEPTAKTLDAQSLLVVAAKVFLECHVPQPGNPLA